MLSIIIPTYNRIDLLPRAIASVLKQTTPSPVGEIELIVIDDGSIDQTEQIIRKNYSQIRYFKKNHGGVSSARNYGIRQANGEWIAFLDSDDEWLTDKLIKQFVLLDRLGLLVCHTQERWIRNGVPVNQMKKHQKQGGWIFEQCLPLCIMSPSSIVIHRQVFDQVGLFDESLPACEDYDLWLRITAQYQVAYVDQPCIIKYGGHADQLSRQYWGMDRFRVISLEKLLLGSKLSKANRSATIKMLVQKLQILLKGAKKHQNLMLIRECKARLEKWQ